jgi:hypothetical protein
MLLTEQFESFERVAVQYTTPKQPQIDCSKNSSKRDKQRDFNHILLKVQLKRNFWLRENIFASCCHNTWYQMFVTAQFATARCFLQQYSPRNSFVYRSPRNPASRDSLNAVTIQRRGFLFKSMTLIWCSLYSLTTLRKSHSLPTLDFLKNIWSQK